MNDESFVPLWFDAWKRLLDQIGSTDGLCLACGARFPRPTAESASPCCGGAYLDARGLHVVPTDLQTQNFRVHAGRGTLAVKHGDEVSRRELGHALTGT